ncbi:MAG: ankyrin repeat domain-containing protein [Alphaproteobacteria bacterium]
MPQASNPVQPTHPDQQDIFEAADKGNLARILTLIEGGMAVDSTNYANWTPLLYAANSGHAEVVRYLLEKGANVNVTEKDGWTPLIRAAHNDHPDTIRVLLEYRADPTPQSKDSMTALDYAKEEAANILRNYPAELEERWRLEALAAAEKARLDFDAAVERNIVLQTPMVPMKPLKFTLGKKPG